MWEVRKNKAKIITSVGNYGAIGRNLPALPRLLPGQSIHISHDWYTAADRAAFHTYLLETAEARGGTFDWECPSFHPEFADLTWPRGAPLLTVAGVYALSPTGEALGFSGSLAAATTRWTARPGMNTPAGLARRVRKGIIMRTWQRHEVRPVLQTRVFVPRQEKAWMAMPYITGTYGAAWTLVVVGEFAPVGALPEPTEGSYCLTLGPVSDGLSNAFLFTAGWGSCVPTRLVTGGQE